MQSQIVYGMNGDSDQARDSDQALAYDRAYAQFYYVLVWLENN